MLICITGMDGSGKTTQVEKLLAYLLQHGSQVIHVSLPPETKAMIKLFTESEDRILAMLAYDVLHRLQSKAVKEALAIYDVIIVDRWAESRNAYLASLASPVKAEVDHLPSRIIFQDIDPDVTILLNTSVATAQRRVGKRGGESYVDQLDTPYHQAMAQYFLARAQSDPRWHIVNGDQYPEEVHREIVDVVTSSFSH